MNFSPSPSTHSDWLTRIRDQSREESASKSHESEEDKQRRMEEREMNKMAGYIRTHIMLVITFYYSMQHGFTVFANVIQYYVSF